MDTFLYATNIGDTYTIHNGAQLILYNNAKNYTSPNIT